MTSWEDQLRALGARSCLSVDLHADHQGEPPQLL
jgi:hypothetical protein